MSEYAYDSGRVPAAPALPVRVRLRGAEHDPLQSMVVAQALVDTGADRTCIPLDMLEVLEPEPVGLVAVEVADGEVRRHAAFVVEIEVADAWQLVKVVGMGDEILLGRDVLNQFCLILDGRARLLTISN